MIELENFKADFKSNKYKNYTEYPSFVALKNKLISINKLNVENGWRIITIEDILKELS